MSWVEGEISKRGFMVLVSNNRRLFVPIVNSGELFVDKTEQELKRDLAIEDGI